MLFNSFEFVLIFLPVTLAGFYLLAKNEAKKAVYLWLAAASLFYYGWWNPVYLWLIGGSIVGNFLLGKHIARQGDKRWRKALLWIGICANLGLLFYFKYAVFVLDNLGFLLDYDTQGMKIILPIGISFFTFQQIAYQVDCYRHEVEEHRFVSYLLFVTFFPQLIAGPIVHHGEMIPQFENSNTYRFNALNMKIGLAMLAVGLFKKVVIADGLALLATPIFSGYSGSVQPGIWESWVGALAYTLQLYYDFSGYSDMALGIGKMFNISLPVNFFSPYKSASIIEFWRRWHITLSRFLRDYLYIPLGGNRKGKGRRYLNLFATMALGGLWHGAGWTFVLWGSLHGIYLMINHSWRRFALAVGINRENGLYRLFAWAATFMAVVIGWVYFRSPDLATAHRMLAGMFAGNPTLMQGECQSGFLGNAGLLVAQTCLPVSGLPFASALIWVLLAMTLALALPNSVEWLDRHELFLRQASKTGARASRMTEALRWQPTLWWGAYCGILLALSLVFMSGQSEFLYFQF